MALWVKLTSIDERISTGKKARSGLHNNIYSKLLKNPFSCNELIQISSFKHCLKVNPVFCDPYYSTEIGLFRVSELELASNFACTPEEVHSKCIILSDNTLYGTTDVPDDTKLDPLPAGVKKLLNASDQNNVPIVANSSVEEAYKLAFPHGIPTWTIHSLLRPGCDV